MLPQRVLLLGGQPPRHPVVHLGALRHEHRRLQRLVPRRQRPDPVGRAVRAFQPRAPAPGLHVLPDGRLVQQEGRFPGGPQGHEAALPGAGGQGLLQGRGLGGPSARRRGLHLPGARCHRRHRLGRPRARPAHGPEPRGQVLLHPRLAGAHGLHRGGLQQGRLRGPACGPQGRARRRRRQDDQRHARRVRHPERPRPGRNPRRGQGGDCLLPRRGAGHLPHPVRRGARRGSRQGPHGPQDPRRLQGLHGRMAELDGGHGQGILRGAGLPPRRRNQRAAAPRGAAALFALVANAPAQIGVSAWRRATTAEAAERPRTAQGPRSG